MDPSFEQRLRDEVVYLHSLWHQGPPPNPPFSRHSHSSSRAIPVSKPVPFKKQNSAATKKKQQHQRHKTSEEPNQPEKEWPCKEEPITQPSPPWPAMKQKESDSGRTSRPATVEEQAKIATQLMQQNALKRCRRLFVKIDSSDGEEEEDDDNDDDGDEMADDRVEGDNGRLEESEEYKFLLDVFVKDRDLREYYERNHESGDFWCFVCGAQGGKMSGRKFKNCAGVLQHSISVSKTKKRRAHRAFGLVVCRVMGWDVERLPLIVVKGEPLSRCLAGPSLSQQTVYEEDAATKSVENYDEEILIPGIDGEGKTDGPIAAAEDDSTGIKNLNRGNIDARAEEENLPQCSDSVFSPASSIKRHCESPVDCAGMASSEWPSFKSPSNSACHLDFAEEKAEPKTWHEKVLDACQAFFNCTSGSDSDSDEEADDEAEDEGNDDEEGLHGDDNGECKIVKFFTMLFAKNAELRSYYISKYRDGNFSCLVCVGVGKKPWKRFKGCTGLLQHSMTTVEMKKRAHRAYGRAMCKLLDWDY
ncbi:hypothetical protein BT93_G0175 [Corymbia citriodora subsp. variegata]|nr:hypothetical protein BT93_G0175 [Corymbia citriodora subsp. variegata]